MKLIGNLKKTVDEIDTKEGKRDAIRKAGILLTDDELEHVSGGVSPDVEQITGNNENDILDNDSDFDGLYTSSDPKHLRLPDQYHS